jgi:hypothetical protein
MEDLDLAIASTAKEGYNNLQDEFKNQLVCVEMDAGRKVGRDFNTIIVNGRFVATHELSYTETKVNVRLYLKAVFNGGNSDEIAKLFNTDVPLTSNNVGVGKWFTCLIIHQHLQ